MADWLYAGLLYLWLAQTIPVGWGTGAGLLPEPLVPAPKHPWVWPPPWELLVLPLVVVVPVLLRRSRPTWLLGTALVMVSVLGTQFMGALALYSYAVWFTNRRVLAAWSIAIVLGIVAALSAVEHFWPMFVVWCVIGVAFPLTFGLWVGTRRELIANLRERTARLERERDLEARNATAAERTRIAREMHDVVAHRVSLMVLHAGGLEVSASDEPTERTAALIRGTGREALTELRGILDVLRDDTGADTNTAATTAPQPGVADLERLLADWRSTGSSVDWGIRGTERPIPAQVERTVYRTAQEALTNAAKHAPGAHVTVEIEYGDTDVRVLVTNGPPTSGGPAPPAPPGGGHGLAGLRERISLAGGELVVGPRPDGGWRIRATVPAADATPPAGTTSGGGSPVEGTADSDEGTGVDTT